MNVRRWILAMTMAGLLVAAGTQAQDAKTMPQAEKPLRASTAPTPAPQPKPDDNRGQRAFEANCSRCHQAPEQLSPRITGTVLMHMRVRASLSKADERALLEFLAP